MSESQPTQGAENNGNGSTGLGSLAAAGAQLARLREAKGWSLEDVSARLKVAPPKLRALESGDISPMPGTAFALGVVRSYARMLGVDPEPFAQALRNEHSLPAVDLSMPASAGTGLPRGRVSISLGGTSRHHPWLWALAAVAALAVVAVVWSLSGEASGWLAHLKQAGAASDVVAEEASSASAAMPVAASEAASEPVAASAGQAASDIASGAVTAAPASAPAVVAAASVTVASAASVAPAAASASADTASAVSAAPAEGQAVVELKVSQDSWFGVRDKDGKPLFSALVHAGSTQQVAGTPPLRVTIGNTLGLESITVDGRAVDPAKYANARGNVAHFTLP